MLRTYVNQWMFCLNYFYVPQINQLVENHLTRMDEKTEGGEDTWQVIAEEGDLKVYKRELEVDGVVIDPLKASYVVKVRDSFIMLSFLILAHNRYWWMNSSFMCIYYFQGITGHEVCHYFWAIDVRMDWDGMYLKTKNFFCSFNNLIFANVTVS